MNSGKLIIKSHKHRHAHENETSNLFTFNTRCSWLLIFRIPLPRRELAALFSKYLGVDTVHIRGVSKIILFSLLEREDCCRNMHNLFIFQHAVLKIIIGAAPFGTIWDSRANRFVQPPHSRFDERHAKPRTRSPALLVLETSWLQKSGQDQCFPDALPTTHTKGRDVFKLTEFFTAWEFHR